MRQLRSALIVGICLNGFCGLLMFCTGTGKFSVMRLNSFVPFPFSLAVSGISISSGIKM